LSRDAASRDRQPVGATVVYGRNAVREAIRGRRRVVRVWATEDARGEVPPAEERHVETASREELELLCESADHQGLVAEVEPYAYVDASTLLEPEQALVIALDQVQDPHNLGAVCRSAESAGASVVIPERRAAAVTGAVCRASAGAVEHLPVARVRNLADFLELARKAGAWVYGAEPGAPTTYTDPDYAGRVVLVLGAEGKGLRPRVRAACDQLVALPSRGKVGSLNVSAAAGVLLYEVLRQRAAGSPGSG
jgi:23S rRNA (guanosine2251-2'-O)-methyltransferase